MKLPETRLLHRWDSNMEKVCPAFVASLKKIIWEKCEAGRVTFIQRSNTQNGIAYHAVTPC